MARVVADLTFSNWDDAVDAADKLRLLDYEVVIDPERIDLQQCGFRAGLQGRSPR